MVKGVVSEPAGMGENVSVGTDRSERSEESLQGTQGWVPGRASPEKLLGAWRAREGGAGVAGAEQGKRGGRT